MQKRVRVGTGYYQADQFEPMMKFFGSGKYLHTKYEDFQKTFVANVK